jgi:SAM-dependent methyltransferase
MRAMDTVVSANEEAIRAWNTVLFDRFVEYRDVLIEGLGAHGDRALALYPPQPGDRVLDIGCGFGDTTQQLGELVGPEGSALGIDAAERFIELAREEAEAAGAGNVRFLAGDVQAGPLDGPFDYAYARFGTMFFANPVAALRNVRAAMIPGARLCMVVWRRKLDNEWLHRAELVVKDFVERPEESDEPTCGPGPFSMADADTTSDVLLHAGFEEVRFDRTDIPIPIGRDLDGAVSLMTALGPAGEVIRLAGEEAERIRPQIEAALREALAEYVRSDGVWGSASTWVVSARNPG